MPDHILVAEDDPAQAETIRGYLEHDGFTVTVVGDGRSALAEIRAHPPSLLLLDVVMPRMNGFDVLRHLASGSGPPVVVVSALTSENDMLLSLDLGADDYLTKPVSPRELIARVRAVLRRFEAGSRARGSGPPPAPPDLPPDLALSPPSHFSTVAGLAGLAVRAGDVVVAPERHEVLVRGQAVDVTPVEFELLLTLVRSPGRVFTRRQLLERVHGGSEFVTERTVDAHVMNLRRKLEEDPRQPVRLLTVYGIGYKFVEVAP